MSDNNLKFKPLIIRRILMGLIILFIMAAVVVLNTNYLCGRFWFVRRYILICPGSPLFNGEQEPGQEAVENCSFNLRVHIKLREAGQEPTVGTGVIIRGLDSEIIRHSVLDENGLVIFEDIPPGIYNLLFANGEYFWIDSTIDLSNCNVNIYSDDRTEFMPDDSEDAPVLTAPVVENTRTIISSKTPVPASTPDPYSTVASTVFPQNPPIATYTGAPVGSPATNTPIAIATPTATSSAIPIPTVTNAGATPSSSPIATNTATPEEPDATPTLPVATITATIVPSSTPSATGTIPTDPTATSGIPSTETPGPTATLAPTKRPTITPRPTYTPWPTRAP